MSELIDASVLDDLIEHIGAEAARSVVELFIGESRELAAVITSSGADRAAIGRAAHSLKSSAGQLGASALSDAALAVETAAGSGLTALPELVAALRDCAARTQAALAARLR
jgi:HPt (histidine-containing phosphotransfer) domain-containing protein